MSIKSVQDKSNSALAELLNEGKTDRTPLNNSVASLEKGDKGNSQEFTIGVPRPELTNHWWTTFTSIPTSQNPLNIENDGVIDDIRQPGEIHFLGGAFGASGETEITREVTVAANQAIVLPILTVGADNVWGNFFENSDLFPDLPPDLPVPYQFPTDELRIICDAIMDTATGVSLEVNDQLLVSDANKDLYRQASRSQYTLNLPEDDILGYRAANPPEWVKPPYTQGVQDGFWVELKKLPLGENTIHFTGTIDYSDIDVRDYSNSGSIGDTPLEAILQVLKTYYSSVSLNVTYNVDVLSRPEFNAQLRG